MVLWYQSAQVPSPTPSLPRGGSTGPPKAAGFSPPLVEASLLLWWGVGVFPPGPEADDFPPWLGVEDFPPWPEVDGFPPWFEVDPVPPRSGVSWAPSCHLSEAPVAGVSVRVGFGGRGRPLGWAIGTLSTGRPWRRGMAWSRPCWATLQW